MDDTTETDRIERDLAATRARLDDRLGELQDHLAPKQMLNDAFAYLRGGEGSDFTNNLILRARANPIPVALTGIGLAWLMASGSTSRAAPPRVKQNDNDLDARLRAAEEGVVRHDQDDDASFLSRLDEARGNVMGLVREASEDAFSYARRVKDGVSSAAQMVRQTSHDVATGAGDTFDSLRNRANVQSASIQEGSRNMVSSTRSTLSSIASNPFALGAIAAVIGAVAGALLPTFDEEEAALGTVATKVRTAGRDLAQDVVDRGGRMASDTLAAVKESAEAHGLSPDRPVGELLGEVTSGQALGNVKEVAKDTVQAGKESARAHLGAGAPKANPSDSTS